jgi:hypothetical protein
MSKQRKAILILGMHRSGTSALARMLNLLGCDLPITLMPAAPANPTGHWESNAIMALNDEILRSGGSNWDDWQEFNPSWYESPVVDKFFLRGLKLLVEEYESSPLFVFKDPRNCRLTRFWFDVLKQAEIDPLVVLPLRNPLEVAASLEVRDGMHRDMGLLLWLRHVIDAEHASRARRRIVITYDDLLDNWAGVADRMQHALGLTWPRFSTTTAADIDAFLSEDKRHHAKSTQNLLSNPMIAQWVRDAGRVLFKWAASGEDDKDHPLLDNIRDQLNDAGPMFGSLTHAFSVERYHNTNLRNAVQVKDTQIAQLNEQLATVQQKRAQQEERAGQDQVDREIHILNIDAERQQLEGERAALQDEIATVRAHAQALEDLRRQDEQTLGELASSQEEKQRIIGDLQRQLTESQEALREDQEQLAIAQADRDANEASSVALQDEIATVRAHAQALEDLRRQDEKSHGELANRLAEQQRIVDGLERQLAESQRSAKDDQEKMALWQSERKANEALFAAEREQLKQQVDAAGASLEQLDSANAIFAKEQETMIDELEKAREDASRQKHELATLNSRLRQREEEIFQTLADLEAERKQLSETQDGRKALERQIDRLTTKLKESDQWVFRLAEERKNVEDRAASAERRLTETQRTVASLSSRLDQAYGINAQEAGRLKHQLEQKIVELETDNARLYDQQAEMAQRWNGAQSELVTLTKILQKQEAEITAARSAGAQSRSTDQAEEARLLSTLLREKESDFDRSARQVEWLQKVNSVVTGYPRWWTLAPRRWRERWQRGRLLRRGLFDAEFYLNRYPDVSSSGMDPLRHYIIHGMHENRTFSAS